MFTFVAKPSPTQKQLPKAIAPLCGTDLTIESKQEKK